MTVREYRHCICRRAALSWRFRVWLRRNLNRQAPAPCLRSRVCRATEVAK